MLPAHVFIEITDATGAIVSGEDVDYLPEVVYSNVWKFRVKFTAETKAVAGGDTGGGTPPAPSTPLIVPAVSVSCSSPFTGIVCVSTGPDTLEISGSYRMAFDDTYQFVRKTGELVVLPPDTTESDIALVKYTMPSSTRRTFSFAVAVDWGAASWEGVPIGGAIALNQWASWNTTAAANSIDRLKIIPF